VEHMQDITTVASSVTGDATSMLSTNASSVVWKYANAYRIAATVTERDNITTDEDDRSLVEEECRHQIKQYMSKYNELIGNMTSKFDVLKWWEEHNTEFPLMWNLAEVYLAIPATSAASECAFSIAQEK